MRRAIRKRARRAAEFFGDIVATRVLRLIIHELRESDRALIARLEDIESLTREIRRDLLLALSGAHGKVAD